MELFVTHDGYRHNVLYNLDGNVVERTPLSHPYNYEEYVVWKSNDFQKDSHYSAVYSDRLYQWDASKYDRCREEVFGEHSQSWDGKKPSDIERFLSIYLQTKVKLQAIVKGCNAAYGSPYWVFFYEEDSNDKR